MFALLKSMYSYLPLQCPEIQTINILDAPRYLGIWHEQTRVKEEFFQSQESLCTQAYYFNMNAKEDYNEEESIFWVENSTQDDINQERHGILGTATCSQGNGVCIVKFNKNQSSKPNYFILDTDYDNFSIVYSCFLGQEFMWVLTRDPKVSSDYYNELLKKIEILMPSFDLSQLIDQEYQGDQCQYMNIAKLV